MDKRDFNKCDWENDWDLIYNKHLEGHRIVFPIKLKAHLGRSPKLFKRGEDGTATVAPQMYVEKLSLDLLRKPTTTE